MSGEPKWTGEQVEQGIHNALKAGNVQAVADLLEYLVRTDPKRGLRVHDEIQDALTVRRTLGV